MNYAICKKGTRILIDGLFTTREQAEARLKQFKSEQLEVVECGDELPIAVKGNDANIHNPM